MHQELELLKANFDTLKLLPFRLEDENHKGKLILKYMLYGVFLIPFIYGTCAELMREIKGERDDLHTFLLSLLTAINGITTVLFIIIGIHKSGKVKALQVKLRELEQYGIPPDIIETEKSCRLYTNILNYYMLVCTIFYVIMPFSDMKNCKVQYEERVHTKHVPCGLFTPMWYPFSYDYTPVLEIVVVYSVFFCYLYCCVVTHLFILCACVISHVLGHIRNLKKYLHEAIEGLTEREEKFKKCVQYHVAIIDLGVHMDGTFSIFSSLLITLIAFIFGILDILVLNFSSPVDLIRISSFLGGWVFVLFMLNNSAQFLSDESMSIADELYDMNFLDLPVLLQKDLMFMMARAQKPITLSTGPIGILGRESFLAVLKTGYSYVAIFANLK